MKLETGLSYSFNKDDYSAGIPYTALLYKDSSSWVSNYLGFGVGVWMCPVGLGNRQITSAFAPCWPRALAGARNLKVVLCSLAENVTPLQLLSAKHGSLISCMHACVFSAGLCCSMPVPKSLRGRVVETSSGRANADIRAADLCYN